MKRVRLLHVCLITLLTPLLIAMQLTQASGQRRSVSRAASLAAAPRSPLTKPATSASALPSGITRRRLDSGRAGSSAPLETMDVTPNTAGILDQNTVWSPEGTLIYFDSNRIVPTSGTTLTAGALQHIWRMTPGGGSLQALTGPSSTGKIGATASQTEPALNVSGTLLYYVEQATGPNPKIVELNLQTLNVRTIDFGTTNIKFTEVHRPQSAPVAVGGGVVFSGRATGDTHFHLYQVGLDNVVAPLTSGNADDRNPSVRPPQSAADQTMVAFDSDRIDASGTGTGNREIWTLVLGSDRNLQKITNFAASGAVENIEPSFSYVYGSAHVNGLFLAFASTRYDSNGDGNANTVNPNGNHNIYWLPILLGTDPNSGRYGVLATEDAATNAAHKLVITNPGPSDPLRNRYDDRRPSWTGQSSVVSVAYDSNRSAFTATTNTSVLDTAGRDIFTSAMLDLDAPTLVRDVDFADIVNVSPGKYVTPGSPVTLKVRVADFGSGVSSVWAQIKNPSGKYEGLDGMEHRYYINSLRGRTLPADPRITGIDTDTVRMTADGANVLYPPIEWDAEPIFIGPDASASVFNTYPRPMAGFARHSIYSDVQRSGADLAFTGLSFPGTVPGNTNADPGWLRFTPVAGSYHSSDGSTEYAATWTTPLNPTDYYVDIIAYDSAVNPLRPNAGRAGSNWIIYDNVGGFTTRAFQPSHGILFVSDYDCGQKFFGQRSKTGRPLDYYVGQWPTASWLTEIDTTLFPRQQFNAKDGTLANPLTDKRNTLGYDSFYDFETDPSQQYDIWRILCRGPLPASVLANYLPHKETQPNPTDTTHATTVEVQVAPSCVIWNSPYAGDLFVEPGTITDATAQAMLHNFVAQGGRLMLNGSDVAWALSNGTPGAASTLLAGDFGVQYALDDVGAQNNDTTQVQGQRLLPNSQTTNPIAHDPWPNVVSHVYPEPNNSHNYPDSNGIDFLHWRYGDQQCYSYGSQVGYSQDVVMATGNGVVDFLYNNPATGAAMIHTDNASSGARTVFSVALETFNPDVFTVPDSGTPALVQFKNRSTEVMHNIICWMRTGSLTGTIVDRDGGAVAGANVYLWYQTSNGNPVYQFAGVTDSQGNYVVNGLPPAGWTIDVQATGYVRSRSRGQAAIHGAVASRFDIVKLIPANPGTINGTVKTGSGAPVVGRTVTATELVAAGTTRQPFTYTATTDNDGAYSLRVASGGVYKITVDTTGFGTAKPASYTAPNPNDPIAGQRDTAGIVADKVYTGFNFVLTAVQGTASGRVVKADTNAPIANATVTATAGTTTVTAKTDASGNFTFSASNTPANGLDPGTWNFTAIAAGYAQGSAASNPVTVSSSTNSAVGDIALTALTPGTITGRVTRTTDGAGIAGIVVVMRDAAGTAIINNAGNTAQATTGSDGSYTIANAPAGGPYLLVATPGLGYRPSTAVPNVSVTVPAGGSIVAGTLTMDPLHSFVKQLSLISSPYDYSAVTAGDLFGIPAGDRTNGAFLFATWANGQYYFYPNPPADRLQRGRGYFMQYTQNIALATPGTAADPTQTFDIVLNPGWNLIGSPFDTDVLGTTINIDWTKVTITPAGGSGALTHDVAVSQGIIGAGLYSYSGGSYVLDYAISPWKGYWVRAYQGAVMHLDPINMRTARSVANPATSRAVFGGGGGWSLNLIGAAGGFQDQSTVIGEMTGASDGFDAHKSEKPPVFGSNYIRVASQHTDWGAQSGQYGIDVRSAAGSARSWTVTVEAPMTNTTATLSWPDVAAAGRGRTLTLTDLVSGAVVDMRSSSSYSWNTGDAKTNRSFRIDAAAATYGSIRVTNVRAQAPSGASRALGVNISYTLSAAANVEVRILSSTGSVVRKVSSRASRAAGINQATWDQRNEAGSAVPAGLYLVEVRAQSSDGKTTAQDRTPVLIVR